MKESDYLRGLRANMAYVGACLRGLQKLRGSKKLRGSNFITWVQKYTCVEFFCVSPKNLRGSKFFITWVHFFTWDILFFYYVDPKNYVGHLKHVGPKF